MADTHCHGRCNLLHPEIQSNAAAALNGSNASRHNMWRSRESCRQDISSRSEGVASQLVRQKVDLIYSFFAGLEEALKFSPSAFFYGLLPPIVFAAGFTLKKREFFRNIGRVLLYQFRPKIFSCLYNLCPIPFIAFSTPSSAQRKKYIGFWLTGIMTLQPNSYVRLWVALAGTISLFAVVGTLISSFVFGFFTYILVAIGIVKRTHLGSSPFLDCMLYGAATSPPCSTCIRPLPRGCLLHPMLPASMLPRLPQKHFGSWSGGLQ